MDINKIKQERASKIEELNAIVAVMEKEERSVKNTEERTKWNTLKSEVEDLEAEIKDAEFAEARKLEDIKKVMKKDQRSNEDKELSRYDLAKAIQESRSNRLEGFEKEMHEEGLNEYRNVGVSGNGLIVPEKILRSFTKGGNSSHYSEIASSEVEYIADRGVLSQLGVTQYDNLSAAMKLTFGEGFNAQFLGEGSAVSDGQGAESTGSIDAKRIQGKSLFSNEFLAQSATMPSLMADMINSIDAAVAKRIFDDIVALSGATLTGYGSGASAKVLTYKDVLKLKGALKSAQFINPRLVAGGELYSTLEGTSKDSGSGRYIIEGGSFNGFSAVDAMGLIASATKNNLIFGDFSKAHVGFYGGIQILVDVYSSSDNGQTKVTYHRLGDVAVNPNAFKTIQNASIA